MASFYGNVMDTNQLAFQFDRIYASRADMDESCIRGTDGIFAGKFVLVKYDPEENTFFNWNVIEGYEQEEDLKKYVDSSYENSFIAAVEFTQLLTEPIAADYDTYFVQVNNKYYALSSEDEVDTTHGVYYQAINTDNQPIKTTYALTPWRYIRVVDYGSNNQILNIRCYSLDPNHNYTNGEEVEDWVELINNTTNIENNYIVNYQRDLATYGNNPDFDIRGYDATVWEKVYMNGHGKFIKVANLNGMIPSLELIADPPSQQPQAPYIDAASSETHYRLHMPTQWGFKIKPVEINELTNTYDRSDVILENQPVAIYMNLGSNPYSGGESQQNYHRQEYHYDTTKNEIIYSYDGQSNKLYNGQHQNDMIQMSVNIPAIGNLLADGYDLIYGKNEPDPNNNNIASRPLDIDWYSGDTNEDIKKNGMSSKGGKTYDLKTLAGTINTAHDILGQIIVDIPSNNYPNEQDLGNMPRNYIYRYQNNYYRVDLITELIDLENDEYRYDLQTGVTSQDFAYNKYYIKQNNNFIPNTEPYNSALENNGYYLRNINTIRYTQIDLIKYEPDTYYYKNGENYYRDSSSPLPLYQENRTYYQIDNLSGKTFHAQYKNDGTFFTEDGNGNFIPSFTETPE